VVLATLSVGPDILSGQQQSVDWPTDGTGVSFKKIGEWPGSLISRDSNTTCATAFIRLR